MRKSGRLPTVLRMRCLSCYVQLAHVVGFGGRGGIWRGFLLSGRLSCGQTRCAGGGAGEERFTKGGKSNAREERTEATFCLQMTVNLGLGRALVTFARRGRRRWRMMRKMTSIPLSELLRTLILMNGRGRYKGWSLL